MLRPPEPGSSEGRVSLQALRRPPDISASDAYHNRVRMRHEEHTNTQHRGGSNRGNVQYGPDPARTNYFSALADRDEDELTDDGLAAAPAPVLNSNSESLSANHGVFLAEDGHTKVTQSLGHRKYKKDELESIERARCDVYQYNSDELPVYGMPWTEDYTALAVYDEPPASFVVGTLCYDQGAGWVAVHPNTLLNTQPWIRLEASKKLTIMGYKYMCDKSEHPLAVPTKEYSVISALYGQLRKKFRAAKKDQYLVGACHAYANNMTPDMASLQELARSTVEYYLDNIKKSHIFTLVRTEEKVYMTTVGPILGPDMGLHSNLARELGRIDIMQPIRVPDIRCDPPNHHDLQYEVRNDFTITPSGDLSDSCTWYRHTIAGDHTNSHIAIPLHPDGPSQRAGYCTVFGSLDTCDRVVYERNSNTCMYRSLARLIKAKVEDGEVLGELECRRNALSLGHHIAAAHAAAKTSISRNLNPCNWGKAVFDGSREAWRMESMLRADRCSGPDDPEGMYGDMRSTQARPGHAPTDPDSVRKVVAACAEQLIDACNPGRIQKWLDGIRNTGSWVYNRTWVEYLTVFHPYLSRESCAMIKHLKRELRKSYVKGVKLHMDDDLMVREIDATVKREIAKAGKNPRFVAAYEAGSMYANELPEFVKVGIDGEHTFVLHPRAGGESVVLTLHIMAKPKADSLPSMFKQLELATSTPNSIYAMIFSDDAVYSGCIGGKSFMFNADVSSNDSSQDVPAFLCAGLAMGRFSKMRARGLLKQCMLPIRVRDKEGGEGSYKIQFKGPFEGSGSVLTTILNHFGSALIAMAFGQLMTDGYEVERAMREGAGLVGHTMTMDVCSRMEDVLFLKRYPVRVGEGWVPQIAGGALLKRFGYVDGDLTHEQLGLSKAEFDALEFSDRFHAHQSGIMKGWKHEPGNPLMNALRCKFQSDKSVEVLHDSLKFVFVDVASHTAVDGANAFARRYRLTEVEVAELVESVEGWSVGVTCCSAAAKKIMAKDYCM